MLMEPAKYQNPLLTSTRPAQQHLAGLAGFIVLYAGLGGNAFSH
jgi:hypothetical protein